MKKLLLTAIASTALLKGEDASSSSFYAGIDCLYWKTEQNDMDYGAVTESESTSLTEDLSGLPVNPNSIETYNSKIIRPNFKYHTGFRLTLGYHSPCSEIDCNLIYTYLPSSVTNTTGIKEDETIVSVFTALPLSNIKTKWSSQFNQFDLDFGKTLNFGTIELRPHVGLRCVEICQRFKAKSNLLEPAMDESNTVFTRWKQNFHGAGIEGGLLTVMNIGCNFSLVGHCGGAILYSKFKTRNKSEASIITDDTSTPTALNSLHDSIKGPTPVFEYFIGFNYSAPLCNTYISFYAGWEQHVYFDMNRLQVGSDEYGNFSTSGLTAGIACMF